MQSARSTRTARSPRSARSARTTRALVATAVAGTLTALSGCGSLPYIGGDEGTVHVWLMRGSVSNELVTEFREAYEADHSGVRLSVTIQEWDGIGEKVSAALTGDSDDRPDLIEVGNTQVARYAAGGGVKDLSDKVGELDGGSWIPGLAEPGEYEGKQYGIPFYAANRVVIYRKDLFKQAGIKSPPRTRKEWITATKALNKDGDQGIYLPGQNWYVLAGFIWDEGGDFAELQKDGTWKGSLDTPRAMAGMKFYQELQGLGAAPKDHDEADPPQEAVFARGKVAQMIGPPGSVTAVLESNPKLEGKIGFYPVPGKTAKKPGAVFTGGSDLIIPERAGHQETAYDIVRTLTGEEWQRKLAQTMSCVPNKVTFATTIDDPGVEVMARGAANGRATPNSAQWAAVEESGLIKTYQAQVLTGEEGMKEAAQEASRQITAALDE